MGKQIRVEIVPWLTELAGESHSRRLIIQEELGGEGTVREVLAGLGRRYPALGRVLLDAETGGVGGHVSIIVNDKLLDLAGGLEAKLKEGDTLVLLPAFQGGN